MMNSERFSLNLKIEKSIIRPWASVGIREHQ